MAVHLLTVGRNDIVRVLGVLLTPILLLDNHVTSLSAKCFFKLRQLRCIRRLLDTDSIGTPVTGALHAFVTSHVNYCVGLLADIQKKTTDKLQCVLKYDRGLTQFQCQTLHWLDIADRIQFRLCIQVYKTASTAWLPDIWLSSVNWSPTSTVIGTCDLLAMASQMFLESDCCSFCYAETSAWNALPDLKTNSTLFLSTFRRQLKYFLVLTLLGH